MNRIVSMKGWQRIVLCVVALGVGFVIGGVARSAVTVLTTVPNERRLISYDAVVQAGGVFHVLYEIHRNWKACHLDIDRYMVTVDSKTREVSDRVLLKHEDRYILRETSNESVIVQIPRSTPPGVYLYYSELAYNCDLMHKILGPWKVRTDGIFFRVTEADK